MFGSSGRQAGYGCVKRVRRVPARLEVVVGVLVPCVDGILGFSGVGSAAAATYGDRVAVQAGGRQ